MVRLSLVTAALLIAPALRAQSAVPAQEVELRRAIDSLQRVLDSMVHTRTSAPARGTATVSDAQDLPAHTARITERFDRFDNTTTVSMSEVKVRVKMRMDDISFGGFFSFKGERATPAETAMLHVTTNGPSWQFLRCHPIVLLVDGEVMRFDKVEHSGSVGRGYVLEQMFAPISAEQVRKLGTAREVEGKICTTEFTFDDNARAAWRDFARRMEAR